MTPVRTLAFVFVLLAFATGCAARATYPPAAAPARQPVVITVQELINRDHRFEVAAGTSVEWADPHFERVWLAPRTGAPSVERTAQGFRAVFSTAGTYRGAFTIVGGHRSDDVYPMVITVTER